MPLWYAIFLIFSASEWAQLDIENSIVSLSIIFTIELGRSLSVELHDLGDDGFCKVGYIIDVWQYKVMQARAIY